MTTKNKSPNNKGRFNRSLYKISTSKVLFFPYILTAVMAALTLLGVHGSSMGIYEEIFYGQTTNSESDVLFGEPRDIRSDEWIVATQLSVAQSNSNFPEINNNLGDGVASSIIVDIPFMGFFAIFEPHNWPFFILPFEYAFSLKWWLMGYFLILSVYFIILLIIPRQYLLASLLGLSIFFSPFIQWWYQYITLAPIYYGLFSVIAFILLSKSTTLKKKIIYTIVLSYTLTSFALVQYPAFQIPVAIVLSCFAIGHLINLKAEDGNYKILKESIQYVLYSAVIALTLTGGFLYHNKDPFTAVSESAYPGSRDIDSGGYSALHLLSSHLSPLFQYDEKAASYQIPSANAINQSESSNFILISGLLLPVLIFLIYRKVRAKEQIDYRLLGILASLILLLSWMFIPGLNAIGKLILLNIVPTVRVIIGLGLINILLITLFMTQYRVVKPFGKFTVIIYSAGVYIATTAISLIIHSLFPAFMGIEITLISGVPFSIITALLLMKRFNLAAASYLSYCILSTFMIHPIHVGTDILTSNPVISKIQSINSKPDEKWVVEDAMLQNFALMAGKPTLTGVYPYPQLDLWSDIDVDEDLYNRYAHVNFVIDRDNSIDIDTTIETPIPDRFGVITEACSDFMRSNNVRYIVTTGKIDSHCSKKKETIKMPSMTVYIYRLIY